MFKKTLIGMLIVVLLFSLAVIPVSAAGIPATAVHNLLDGAVCELYKDGKLIADTYFDPTTWQQDAHSLRYRWEYSNNTIYYDLFFTIQCARKPDRFYVYDTEAEYLGAVGSGYHMYKYPNSASHDYIYITAEWDEAYRGSFHLVSAFGCVDTSENIPRVGFEVSQTYVENLGLVQDNSYTLPDVTLPWGVRCQRNDGVDLTDAELTIKIKPEQRDIEFAESMTVVFAYHGHLNGASAALYDSAGRIVTPLDVVDTAAFGYENLKGDKLEFDLYYQAFTIDLHGYDLEDLSIYVELSIGATYLGNMDLPDGCVVQCHSVYMTPVYEQADTFKGKVTYFLEHMWESIKGGFDKIGDKIESAANQEQTKIENAANDAVSDAMEVIPDKSAGIVDGFGPLVEAMSYTGTDAVLTTPAVYFPRIEGVVDRFRLLPPLQIDFGWWVNQLPGNILNIIRLLGSVGIVVFSFKELYSVLAYAFTLKGGKDNE